jgi:serine phosphatase RsbU (regulator of sigma subunit)
MPSGEAALNVTDIAGHGPEAGVAAMRIKHLLAQMLASGSGPADAISLAARTFADEVGRFATVAVICVDPVTGAVTWANGGHVPPVVLKADGTIEELGRTGPLLSWLGGPWGTSRTTIGDGSVLLAFSDGLVESRDDAGTQLEVDGLVRMYRAAQSENASDDEAVRRTLARARQRSVDWDRDDVTLVALRLTALVEQSEDVQPNIPDPRPVRPGDRNS